MFWKREKRPAIKGHMLSSLIAEDVQITGDLYFASGIRIDGHVTGNLIGRAVQGQPLALLVLSAKGRIEGTVICGDAVIDGNVVGDMDIEHCLHLQSNSRVSGSIRYCHLQMDVGASVRGQLFKADTPSAVESTVESTVASTVASTLESAVQGAATPAREAALSAP